MLLPNVVEAMERAGFEIGRRLDGDAVQRLRIHGIYQRFSGPFAEAVAHHVRSNGGGAVSWLERLPQLQRWVSEREVLRPLIVRGIGKGEFSPRRNR